MTSSNASKAAAGGITGQDQTQPAASGAIEEKTQHGLSVLRLMEAQSLMRIVMDALWESSLLAADLNDDVGLNTGKVAPDVMQHKLLEAMTCLETADHYLRMLDGVIDPGEPLPEEPITLR